MVIQKQRFAIADRHALVTATTPSLFLLSDLHPYRSRILLVGHHQGGCRSISPGLHRIESVSSCCEMVHNKIRTLNLHGSFLSSLATVLYYQRAPRRRSGIGDPGGARATMKGAPSTVLEYGREI